MERSDKACEKACEKAREKGAKVREKGANAREKGREDRAKGRKDRGAPCGEGCKGCIVLDEKEDGKVLPQGYQHGSW